MRKLFVSGLASVLLVSAFVGLSTPARAQLLNGPYADELLFSVVPTAQAIASLTAGDTDVYIYGLTNTADKIAARDDPNLATYESFSNIWDVLVNPVPHGPGVPGINPFAVPEIREALNRLFDRNFVLNQIYGGFGVTHTLQYFSQQPDYVREIGFMSALERSYSYNPTAAIATINAEMSKIPGVTLVGGNWRYNNVDIVVKIVQRTEDSRRFDMGAHMAAQIESAGFTAQLDPSTGGQAFAKVYSGDPDAGVWHLYTEGWGLTGFLAFDDGNADFFYNGDFGSAIWQDYSPPPALSAATQALYNGDYIDLAERQELIRKATELGVQDGVRVFMVAERAVFATRAAVTDTTFDLFAGLANWFSMKTARLGGTTGGTIKVTQPTHTISAWNPVAGFDWVYENNQLRAFADPGVITHPHTGSYIPYRAAFDVDTRGPVGTHTVPDTALQWNQATNVFEQVGAGVVAKSKVTFDYTFGDWHHGVPMTMQDIVNGISFSFRLASGGDLYVKDDIPAQQPGLQLFQSVFRGFEVVDADTITVYVDYWNIDEPTIAASADVWTIWPWEVKELTVAGVLADELVYDEDTAAARPGTEDTDLVKGNTLPILRAHLTTLRGANAIPAGMDDPALLFGRIDAAAATARWNAISSWDTAEGHFLPSNGPFWIDGPINPGIEQTSLKAFRTGYPWEADQWDSLAQPRVPSVTLGTAPAVVQTFPATFSFTTTVGGLPYDRVASSYIVLNPGTGAILLSGEATRTGAGAWSVTLAADETVKFVQGTYRFQAIVVGEEAAIPVVQEQDFLATSLSTALLTEIRAELDQRLTIVDNSIANSTQSADDARTAAQNAANLASTTLIIAVLAVLLAITNIALIVVRTKKSAGPSGPSREGEPPMEEEPPSS